MVEFGADWCPDCQVLTKQLNEPLLRDYVSGHFVVYTVDVGQFDKNLDLAKSLGVDVGQGIPTAAFLSADGKNLGATNGGELARASKDGSQTLYAFLVRFAEGVTPPPPQPPSSSE